MAKKSCLQIGHKSLPWFGCDDLNICNADPSIELRVPPWKALWNSVPFQAEETERSLVWRTKYVLIHTIQYLVGVVQKNDAKKPD